MVSKLQFDEVLQQINDDSDWCDSDDDLVTDKQVGDLESFSFPKACDPLDRVDEEIEEEETSFVPSSEELSSGQTPTASTGDNSTNSSTLPSTSNCFLPTPGPKVDNDPESHPIDLFVPSGEIAPFRRLQIKPIFMPHKRGRSPGRI